MDVNGTPFFLFRDREDFANSAAAVAWNPRQQALRLAQNQALRLPDAGTAASIAAWESAPPLVLDLHGQIGRLAAGGGAIEYNAGRRFERLQDAELADVVPPVGAFHELALGGDGRLAAAFSDGSEHGIVVFHLGRRWTAELRLGERVARLAVDRDNRIWCVTASELLVCGGEPLPFPYRPSASRFEPETVNPGALRVLGAEALPAGLTPLSLCVRDGRVLLLLRDAAAAEALFERPRGASARAALRRYELDPALPFVIDLGFLDDDRVAAMCAREAADPRFLRRDCPVLELDWDGDAAAGTARLVGERYPMLSQAVPRFVSSLDGGLRYQAEPDPALPQFAPRPRRLQPLNKPQYRTDALVTLRQRPDSGVPGMTWHRVYMDAVIPPGCKVTLYAKAYDDPEERRSTAFVEQPPWLWNARPSELAFAPGIAGSRRNESGLFEILLQKPAGNVRRLAGRYLQLRLRLSGDGRRTPCVHALRVYAPRLSYQEAYLPEHFRQQEDYRATDAAGLPLPANGADVRERLLAAVEGLLTPIEGQVAAAEALTHPAAAPAEHLPWLAEALGVTLPEYWPERRRRALLRHAGRLQRWRGTLAGVCLAVDIATDGAVGRGEIAIVENFRLRRTMATILGLSFDDRDHPLTLGTGMSGNSVVGDSLILAERDAREFLALLAPELADASDETAVREFFDRYAQQVSVLLLGAARAARDLVLATLAEHMPAHLEWRLLETDHPFVPGIAPLLGVDTFLEKAQPQRRATLDDTWLGKEGVLTNPLAFSPEDANARASVAGR